MTCSLPADAAGGESTDVLGHSRGPGWVCASHGTGQQCWDSPNHSRPVWWGLGRGHSRNIESALPTVAPRTL